MSLSSIIIDGSGWLAAALTIIQVVPIKINPWTAIAKSIGRALNREVMEKIEENEITTSRYRILRFEDEVRHGTRHTREHFEQILDDINTYEAYCAGHPNYRNNRAKFAIEKIKEIYRQCTDDNTFL